MERGGLGEERGGRGEIFSYYMQSLMLFLCILLSGRNALELLERKEKWSTKFREKEEVI